MFLFFIVILFLESLRCNLKSIREKRKKNLSDVYLKSIREEKKKILYYEILDVNLVVKNGTLWVPFLFKSLINDFYNRSISINEKV